MEREEANNKDELKKERIYTRQNYITKERVIIRGTVYVKMK